ncbi:actin-5 [Rhinolophus sinicus]|uniref:actin-5 n=1 Tax=Rhinolophus sinicus TaxID=89399 RepID=UPI003D78D7D0
MSVPLVCDYGSGFCKVGFSGTDAPMAVFPTILGKLRHDNWLVGMEEEDWFIGEEVQRRREKLSLQYPIARATVTNWDDMEKIWHHSFYQLLHTAPEQHPLMLTEPPLNTMSNKEKVSEILFETFNVPALYLANQGVLSLYASGLTTGTTIESGEGMTYFVPITDGCPLHQSTMKMDMAGQDITLYLLQRLSERGHSFTGTGDREYIRDMKEKCCYVALDFDKEEKEAQSPPPPQKYLLPDGREIDLGPERFFCPEVLFQADLMGEQWGGQHQLLQPRPLEEPLRPRGAVWRYWLLRGPEVPDAERALGAGVPDHPREGVGPVLHLHPSYQSPRGFFISLVIGLLFSQTSHGSPGVHLSLLHIWRLGRWFHPVLTLYLQGHVGHQQ